MGKWPTIQILAQEGLFNALQQLACQMTADVAGLHILVLTEGSKPQCVSWWGLYAAATEPKYFDLGTGNPQPEVHS